MWESELFNSILVSSCNLESTLTNNTLARCAVRKCTNQQYISWMCGRKEYLPTKCQLDELQDIVLTNKKVARRAAGNCTYQQHVSQTLQESVLTNSISQTCSRKVYSPTIYQLHVRQENVLTSNISQMLQETEFINNILARRAVEKCTHQKYIGQTCSGKVYYSPTILARCSRHVYSPTILSRCCRDVYSPTIYQLDELPEERTPPLRHQQGRHSCQILMFLVNLKTDPKYTKGYKERLFIGQNKTKCTNFRGNPLFSKPRALQKQTIHLSFAR